MPKLLWVTDPHLDHPHHWGSTARFTSVYLREKHPSANSLIITGDIGEAFSVGAILKDISHAWEGAVYYVLGNHDFYGSSIENVEREMRALDNYPNLTWLTASQPIWLSPDTALCGVDGWYDGKAGDLVTTSVRLNDQRTILDFQDGRPVEEVLASLSQKYIKIAQTQIESAISRGAKKILFATHVPPFVRATFHMGNVSDNNWLPWMCNRSLGDYLALVALENPEVDFTVLCGHTHSPGKCYPVSNMEVLTGKSRYGRPQVSGMLEVVGAGIIVEDP